MEVKRRTAQSLVKRLRSEPDDVLRSAAIAEIRLLTKHDPEIRTPLADAGAIPLLASLLLDPPSSTTVESQENASAALLNLSISAGEALMSTPGLLDALAQAVCPSAPAAVAQHASATIYSLLSVDAYRPIIGSKRGLISSLISLIRSPNSPTRSVKDALKALFGISLYPLNRPPLVDLGAVPALFSLVVNDGRIGVVEDATAVIAQIAGCYESVDAFRKVAGVAVLVDLVDSTTETSERTRENAASALLNLAMCGGDKAVGDIREIVTAEMALRELAVSGSSRAKSKAESLLRVLVSGRESHHHRFSDFQFPSSLNKSSSSLDSTF